MIEKPQGYDEAMAYTGESVQLPAGLYVCVIKQAVVRESQNHRPQCILLFDIAEGEYAGFYKKRYEMDRKESQDATWKGVHRQLMDGSSVPFFKGMITSIEKSNGFQFPWNRENNEKVLAGKKFGAVMGREEFIAKDGSSRFATKIFQIRSVDGLKDAKIPEDKLLQPQDKPDPVEVAMQHGTPAGDGFMNIPDGLDEELPFM